jgi:hypothetical protein
MAYVIPDANHADSSNDRRRFIRETRLPLKGSVVEDDGVRKKFDIPLTFNPRIKYGASLSLRGRGEIFKASCMAWFSGFHFLAEVLLSKQGDISCDFEQN